MELLRVSLDEPLETLEVRGAALLVVIVEGTVVGEVPLEPAEDPKQAIDAALGDAVAARRLRSAFIRATRAPRPDPAEVPVSVVVRADTVTQRSLDALDPQPCEVVAHVSEARGELVAFLEPGQTVEPDWLAGIEEAFRDPLRGAVKGYVPPRGARSRVVEDGTYDCFSSARPPVGRGNYLVRSSMLLDASEEELYARLIRDGRRVYFDPSRIAWPGPIPLTAAGSRRSRSRSEPEPPRVVRDADAQLTATIASYNRRESLAQVLTALGRQTYPSERFDVVIVLDGSTDGSAERARSLDVPYRMRVVEQENRGLAASRNRGAKEATGDIVIFLDDDVVPDPQFVAEHAAAQAELSGGALVLGSYPPADRPYERLHSILSRQWWEDYFRRRAEPDHKWVYTDFSDGNVSFPRDLVAATGGWSEEFVRETVRRQDWEYGVRLLQNGVSFIDRASASAQHHFELTFEQSLRHRRVEGSADVVLGEKHPEVRKHLPIAQLEQGTRSRALVELVYRSRRAAEGALNAGASTARLLERLDRRAAWFQLEKRLATLAYVLGVSDRLRTMAELGDFIASGPPAPVVRVPLDGEGPLDVPPAVGQLELVVELQGSALARVEALEPVAQWDWDTVTKRVVREALEPFKRLAPDAAR